MNPITNINQLDFSKRYTYADYMSWQFPERVELLRGKLYTMSPAPNLRHQLVSGNIFGFLWIFLKDKPCRVFSAPFDVRLPVADKKGKKDTVVQPDITVVCNPDVLGKQGCTGVPDLVVEVLSPGNTTKEMRDKFDIYEEAGVKEYWLAHPSDNTVIVYSLNENEKYIGSRHFTIKDTVESSVVRGFDLRLKDIF